MVKSLAPLIAASGAGIVSLLVGWWLGQRSGRRSGSRLSAKELREARTRSQMLKRDLGDARRAQQKAVELLVNLPDAVNKIGSARSTSDLCRISARALMDYAGAQKMGLFLFDEARGVFVLEVYAGGRPVQREVCLVPGQGRLGRLAQLIGVRDKGEVTAVVPQGFADELFAGDLCVAMRRHEKTYAFVVLDGVAAADQMVRRVVQMIADVHAVSAEGVRALDAEREKADVDQLTGLYNRRHMDRRLADELDRARSYNVPLSVFLFDVDNFKNYNDSNGHQAGDLCLQSIAALARQVTRASDVVCRYGGEEFLVILIGASAQEALFHADRIRQVICSTPFEHGATQPLGCVSISGGVATCPDDARDAATLVQLADQALYQAKEQGRNRVLTAASLSDLTAQS